MSANDILDWLDTKKQLMVRDQSKFSEVPIAIKGSLRKSKFVRVKLE